MQHSATVDRANCLIYRVEFLFVRLTAGYESLLYLNIKSSWIGMLNKYVINIYLFIRNVHDSIKTPWNLIFKDLFKKRFLWNFSLPLVAVKKQHLFVLPSQWQVCNCHFSSVKQKKRALCLNFGCVCDTTVALYWIAFIPYCTAQTIRPLCSHVWTVKRLWNGTRSDNGERPIKSSPLHGYGPGCKWRRGNTAQRLYLCSLAGERNASPTVCPSTCSFTRQQWL